MPESRYMSANEVAAELGISVATVYAYVSRGLLRSEAAGGKTRNRRYYREDVERLKQRNNPEKLAESALDFGTPLLESSLTLIADGHLYYRGRDACELARTHSIEQVAALLWTGELETDIPALWDTQPSDIMVDLPQSASTVERFQATLPIAALKDVAAYDLRSTSVIQTGARILRLLAAIAIGQPAQGSIARALQQAWCANDTEAAALLNMALILCADHELNVSSFTARCVASAGSTPYATVIAGLAALQGTKHGGSTDRVMALIREISADVRPGLANRIKRGESVPGFGHRLYPDGDPRGRLLLNALADAHPNSESLVLAHTIVDEVYHLLGEHPNIDFALVMLALKLDLPDVAPIALFALGRTVGWIGHALEQYETNQLIRPRARYVGVQPST